MLKICVQSFKVVYIILYSKTDTKIPVTQTRRLYTICFFRNLIICAMKVFKLECLRDLSMLASQLKNSMATLAERDGRVLNDFHE